MKYQKEAVEFLDSISKTDETVIIFNNDGDGICSCALLMKFIASTGRKSPYIISQPMPMAKNLVQRIKTTIPNKIIFLDLVADQQEDLIKKIKGLADVLIIDHHQITKNLNEKQADVPNMRHSVVHFNPRFTDSKNYTSTTYNVYKICSEMGNVSDHLWLAAVGMVSDYNLDDSKDVVNLVKKKYVIEGGLYGSFIGRLADMIFSTRATKDLSCEQMTELFAKAGSYEALRNTEGYAKMLRASQIINEEINSIMLDAREDVKKDGNLVVYNIKSKYNLDSVISTKISEKHLDKLVVVYSKTGSRYKISARNQKKNINAGRVMQNATKGLKATGGGHEAAAGATVDEKDWDKFIERVTELANR